MTGNKLLRLPEKGRLLVCADLRGNLRDFLTVVQRFERRTDDAYLLFLGDLIHGPPKDRDPEHWPPSLGRPYRDDSPALLLKLSLLMENYPGRVFALLGNHEHAHIGGPRTGRFVADEVSALEGRLPRESVPWLRRFLLGWPVYARTQGGLWFGHRPLAQDLLSTAEIDTIDYNHYLPLGQRTSADGWFIEGEDRAARLCGQIFWTQPYAPAIAKKALSAVEADVMVYGHEIVQGVERIGDEQVILSSSFGIIDRDKRILSIDLGADYRSAAQLRSGHEVLPLYAT